MLLDAKQIMCPFKNCLTSYFVRMSVSRKSCNNVFVILCHSQIAMVFAISVCLLPACYDVMVCVPAQVSASQLCLQLPFLAGMQKKLTL